MRSYKNYKENERSGAGINKSRKYIYHEQVRFLEKVTESRETTSSINLEDGAQCEEILQTESTVEKDDYHIIDVELTSPQKSKRSKNEKQKNQSG